VPFVPGFRSGPQDCTLNLMTRLLPLLLALPLLAASPEQPIRQVLDDQVAAWNRGDIPGFMEGYDKSESTTFVGATITKGHAQVLASYFKRYPTRENMGTLKFTGLEIRPLGPDYASVIGRFHLDRSPQAGGESSGIFTLLFHRTGKGWKIILDHTS
jgi:ketosteroid isomerase-like protein